MGPYLFAHLVACVTLTGATPDADALGLNVVAVMGVTPGGGLGATGVGMGMGVGDVVVVICWDSSLVVLCAWACACVDWS